ncbi:Lsr2 family protein [Nocardioides sp. TF02-7]|uniref:histone-like nucleoid-structuring protein Lsr2 n=1 Tax=Nocardioides sp. TF02-7 TaxID=2917724 RepID=UPI001F069AD5|nr:Lsr2 family protein [Nocardioides sp. TF02-7]UMG93888.1 Lsr2 family protein [Nocardioides sp. TF02-7]
MAQRVNIVLVDDIDGSDATQTVSFGLDGTSYEIDLNDEHAGELREALATYVGHARKVAGGRRGRGAGRSGGSAGSGSSGASGGGASAREIREWARANGHEVPDRGRIPAEVRSAYESAH